MAIKVLQNNFTTGVISPQVRARVDLAKYEGACQVIKNAIVMAQGGVTKRPGTRYVAQSSDGLLIPFVYSRTQSYALLFTDHKVEFFTHEGQVMDGKNPYTVASEYALEDLPLLKFAQSADVLYLTHPKHPPRKLMRYDHTDWQFEDVEFMPAIEPPGDVDVEITGFTDSSGTYLKTITEYKIAAVNADGEESLPSEAASAMTLSTWPQGARVTLDWADVPGAVRYEVYKNQHGWFEWAGSTEKSFFEDDNIEPDSSISPKQYRNPFHAPDTPTISVSGSETYEVRVSAVNSGGAESVACATVLGTTVTITPEKDVEFYNVYYRLPGDRWKYTIATQSEAETRFEVNNGLGSDVAAVYERKPVEDGIAKNGNPVYAWKLVETISGSHSSLAYTGTETPTTSTKLYWIRWNTTNKMEPPDKVREMSEQILRVFEPTVNDVDLSLAVGTAGTPLDEVDCYPGAVGIYQQRLMFGGTAQRPQTVWLSETGSFNSMAVSEPLRDDSAITVTVDTRQMNEVRHFVALGDAFVMTNATEFRMQGKEGAITPGTISFRPQSYWGSSHVPPIVVGTTILMVDASGRVIRDVHYNLQEDGYTGDNRSILAEHLFPVEIVDWAFQQNPFSTVYAVRKDGVLLTFTYMREQEIWAWAEHETQGNYKSVCCVPEDGKDRVWFLVERGGKYFVEEQVLREYGKPSEDSWFVDCGLDRDNATLSADVSGLDHLEGQTVYGVADGSLVGSRVVRGGRITLEHPAKHVIVGLPYQMEVVTVDPDVKGQDGTRFGSRKTLGPVTFEFLETATMSAGADENHMEVLKIPTTKQWGKPVVLFSGKKRSAIPGYARDEASLRFTNSDPFPATVLAVRTEVNVE